MPKDLHLASLDTATLWSAIESAAEQAQIALYVARIDGHPQILYANQRAAEIAARSCDELIGKEPWSILRADDHAVVRGLVERPLGAPPASVELTVVRPDGSFVPITLATTRMQTALGLLSFGYFRDLSAERAAIDALRRSEARFRLLVESAPDGVVILKRGVIAFMNPRAAALLGTTVEEARGTSIAAFLPPDEAELTAQRIAKMMREGTEMSPNEYHAKAFPDRVVEIKSIICEWDGEPAVLALARDVSERKQIERRLIESDRLAALGRLAAGVAHEINNPLTYVQLSTQLVTRTLASLSLPAEVAENLRECLADIDHGITRVASITQALRSFVTAQEEAPPGPVDLDAVVSRALKMVANELRHVAELVRESAEVSPVIGHESRLEQVVVNLLINAIKAVPIDSGRHHEIFVGTTQQGDRVTLTIRDTGSGIPAWALDRIFDPFFTTRALGTGMGLGLPLSKSIVEQYGGSIEVSSVEGAGTTARVHLRAHVPVATGAAPPASETKRPRKRVLVVDDEPLIRAVLQRILGTEHDVMCVSAGEQALAVLETEPFDLILCDVMMPGMSGLEVHRRIAASRPGLEQRVVFMSGGTIGSVIEQQLDELRNHRLAKPFTVEQALDIVDLATR